MVTNHSLKDLSNTKIGRLFITSMFEKQKNGIIKWYCVCECGEIKKIFHFNLTRPHTQSCGCIQKENAANAQLIHGNNRRGNKSSEYHVWTSMKTRCYNENSKFYSDYGGRGIIVCDRWLHSFENFLFDMDARPSKNHTIERIENNGIYEQKNCKWATVKEQARNKRNNTRVEYGGRNRLLLEICEELGLKYKTVQQRIKRGWDINLAINTPHERQNKYRI